MFKMKKNIKKLKSEGSSCIAAAFEIHLSIRLLLRLLLREICIFFNVFLMFSLIIFSFRRQIIAEAQLS